MKGAELQINAHAQHFQILHLTTAYQIMAEQPPKKPPQDVVAEIGVDDLYEFLGVESTSSDKQVCNKALLTLLACTLFLHYNTDYFRLQEEGTEISPRQEPGQPQCFRAVSATVEGLPDFDGSSCQGM